MEVQETLTLVILTGLKSPGRRRSMRRLIPVFCFIHPPPLTLFILLLTRSFTRTLDSSAKCEGVCVCFSKGFLHPLPSAGLAVLTHTHTGFTLRVILRFGLGASSLRGRFRKVEILMILHPNINHITSERNDGAPQGSIPASLLFFHSLMSSSPPW